MLQTASLWQTRGVHLACRVIAAALLQLLVEPAKENMQVALQMKSQNPDDQLTTNALSFLQRRCCSR